MNAPLNLAMAMTLNSAGVKTGATEAKGEFTSVGTTAQEAATTASASVSKLATSLQSVGQASAGIRADNIIQLGTAVDQTTTKMQRMINAWVGMRDDSGSRAWTGVLASEGASLDALRAKYSPLYATISQYKQVQMEIRAAHAMGALSADEMTAALSRERQATLSSIDAIKGRNQVIRQQASLSPAAPVLNNNRNQSFNVANVAAQAQDIVVTSLMGMPAGQIGMQQGLQMATAISTMERPVQGLLQGFASMVSPVTLITVGLTTASAAVIQMAMSWASSAKKIEEDLKAEASLVEQLTARFREAAEAKKAYAGTPTSVLTFQSEVNVADLRKDLLKQAQSVADEAFFITNPLTQARPEEMGMKKAFDDFVKSVEAGDPKVLEFRKNITAFKDSAVSDIRDLAKEWLTVTDAAATTEEKINELSKVMDAITPKQRALAEANRRALEGLSGRGSAYESIDNYYANSKAGFDSKESIDFMRSGTQQLETLRSERDALGKTGEALIAFRYEQQRLLEARHQGIALSDEQRAALNAEAQAYAALKDQVAGFNFVKSSREQVEALGIEAAALGQSGVAAAAYKYEQQKLLEARQQNIDLTAEERAAIKEQAAAYAELQSQISAISILKSQQNNLETSRTELALVGQSENVQARTLALLQAEQQIRNANIDASSKEADQIRRNAVAQADVVQQLSRQKAAWDEVTKAGGTFIDTLTDGLATGEFDFDSMLKDLQKQLMTLAVGNPAKNLLFGQNLPTLSDVWGQLTGNGELSATAQGSTVSTMAVQATTVMVNGSVMSGAGAAMPFSAANTNALSLIGGTDLLSKYRDAIASIESGGNYGALGPITKSGDRAYGRYGVMGANIGPWTQQTLGASMTSSQFLASSSAQDAVFNKMFGSYLSKYGNADDAASAWFTGRPLAQGANATDVLGTTGTAYVEKFSTALGTATTGLESFASSAKGTPTSSTASASSYPASLTLTPAQASAMPAGVSAYGTGWAEQQVAGIGSIFSTLTNGLGGIVNQFLPGLGSVLGQLLNGIAGAGSGGTSSGGGIFSWLFSGLGSLFGGGGWGANNSAAFTVYDSGGFTGAGGRLEPAGVVHRGEYVFDAEATGAIGVSTLEGLRQASKRGYVTGGFVGPLRGYASGGLVDGGYAKDSDRGAAPASAEDSGSNILIQNFSGSQVTHETTRDSRGRRQEKFVISDAVGDAVATPGGGADRAMRQKYGMRSGGIRR